MPHKGEYKGKYEGMKGMKHKDMMRVMSNKKKSRKM